MPEHRPKYSQNKDMNPHMTRANYQRALYDMLCVPAPLTTLYVFVTHYKSPEADKLDDQPHTSEITLIEQTIAFCKNLTKDLPAWCT